MMTNRARRHLKSLTDDWTRFRNVVASRLGAEDVGSQEESRYLDLQGRITRSLAEYLDRYGSGAGSEGATHQRQMTELLNRFSTLRPGRPLSENDASLFEREWHRHFLFLNRLQGLPASGRPKTAVGRGPIVPAPAPARPQSLRIRRGWKPVGRTLSWTGRVVLGLLAVLFVILVLPYERLGIGELAPDPAAGGVRGGLGDLREGVTNALARVHVPTIKEVFDPVVAQWGIIPTVAMILLLLLAVGYWFFIRKA